MDCADVFGATPIICAVQVDHPDLLEVLLHKNASTARFNGNIAGCDTSGGPGSGRFASAASLKGPNQTTQPRNH